MHWGASAALYKQDILLGPEATVARFGLDAIVVLGASLACLKLSLVARLLDYSYKQLKAYGVRLQEKYGDKIEKILYGPEEDGYAVGSLKDKKKPIIFRQAPELCCLLPGR